jgi:hypothetical protein
VLAAVGVTQIGVAMIVRPARSMMPLDGLVPGGALHPRQRAVSSVIVLLSLVSDPTNGDGSRVFNLEVRHVFGPAEWNNKFANSRVVRKKRFPARERRVCEQPKSLLQRCQTTSAQDPGAEPPSFAAARRVSAAATIALKRESLRSGSRSGSALAWFNQAMAIVSKTGPSSSSAASGSFK